MAHGPRDFRHKTHLTCPILITFINIYNKDTLQKKCILRQKNTPAEKRSTGYKKLYFGNYRKDINIEITKRYNFTCK